MSVGEVWGELLVKLSGTDSFDKVDWCLLVDVRGELDFIGLT